jgi:hypothetical protein
MNGTLLYKLNRQNRKLRLKTVPGENPIVVNKPPSRLLIREKVQWQDRRRLMTESARLKDLSRLDIKVSNRQN